MIKCVIYQIYSIKNCALVDRLGSGPPHGPVMARSSS